MFLKGNPGIGAWTLETMTQDESGANCHIKIWPTATLKSVKKAEN